jgi:hypothetical protein
MEIDLVYLWVDGRDSAWLAKKVAFTGEFRERSETDDKARYEDNEELKYSLRSAEKFAPWIRKIFIVTDNQVPAWLDTSNERVRIVDHTEILPPESLPCFNSTVLEHYLWRIPDLAEHFLLSNDDTLFGSSVTPDFFFTSDGLPIVRLKRKRGGKLRWAIKRILKVGVGHHRTKVYRSALMVKEKTGKFYSGIPHHNIDAYRRSDLREAVEEVFAEQVEKTAPHHVRTDGNLHRSAFGYYAIATGRARLKYVDNRESCRIPTYAPDFMRKYVRFRPALFCLNDSQKATNDDRKRILPFLESLFPEKSAFEK